MTDGFYVDVYPESDSDSPTKLLDSDYRWRGVVITPQTIELNRSSLCFPEVVNLEDRPRGLFEAIYKNHIGTMLHFVHIHRLPNLKEVFDTLYVEDVEKQFAHRKIYPRLNIIGLEINMHGNPLPEGFEDDLYKKFDVIPIGQRGTSFCFVNEILSYLQ